MLRLALALAAATALAACGSGSDSNPSSSGPAAGTILGQAFNPTDTGALVVPATTCTIPSVGTRSVAALLVGFSSFPNLCGFVQAGQLCAEVTSSRVVTAIIANAPLAGPAPAIAPGTYQIGTSVDAQLNVRIVDADLTKVDAACVSDPALPTASPTGTITVTSVSPRVTGSLDVTFSGDSRFAGTFDAALCTTAVDFCAAATDTCATTTCCSSATSCP